MIPSLRNANDRLVEIADKFIPLRFGFDRSIVFPPEAIGLAGFQQGFADRDTGSGGEVGLGPVLNNPAALLKKEINLLPRPLFWGHGWARAAASVQRKSLGLARNRKFGGRNRIDASVRITDAMP
jgi:hypothetical protein